MGLNTWIPAESGVLRFLEPCQMMESLIKVGCLLQMGLVVYNQALIPVLSVSKLSIHGHQPYQIPMAMRFL